MSNEKQVLPSAAEAARARFNSDDEVIAEILTFMPLTSSKLMYLTDVQVKWLVTGGYHIEPFQLSDKHYNVIWS